MADLVVTPAMPPRLPLVWHLARMELRAFLKHPLAVFWTFVYPLILFGLMNAIFGQRPAVDGALSYSDYLISGIAVLTVVSTALFSFALPLIELRARSRFKVFAAMPLPQGSFFLGYTASRVVVLTLFSALFMGLLSHLAPNGSALSVQRDLQLTLFLMAGALVLIGAGIVLASRIQRTATAHAITNIVNVPVIFLSDLFLPVALFPPWLQTVAHASPVYLFVQALRRVYAGQMPGSEYLGWVLVMGGLGLLLIGIGARLFAWTPASEA